MISYEKFSKHYGSLAAVRELDLEVHDGETLALVGPNGSGKTTTLKSALGLVRPSAGRVTVNGIDVATDGCAARRRIGYLPQRLSFPDGCSALQVIRLYADLRGEDARAVAALLERVGLDRDAERAVENFSGGMRQRLGIAISLLGDPDILILDEPTSALDPSGALMMRDLVREIGMDGKTVLLSSHDLSEVEALADRVAVFAGGRMVALGDLDQLAAVAAKPVGSSMPDITGAVSLEDVYRHVIGEWRAA